ncbi:Carboxylesterase [Pseudozyma hubeiensis]|nr:Carboxylesterase [Pseudozyma hubeiensis]
MKMPILHSIVCLVCSFVTCINSCKGRPIPACPGNDCVISSYPSSNPLQVDLPLGTVLGTKVDYSAQRFTLPYAQPPVGQLRFASPQSLTLFDASVYEATKLPSACMQQLDGRYNIADVSEDCLYLNIYRPTPSGSAKNERMPVMVWIHGGSFVSGSSTAPGLDGSWLASQNNVIVVTIQYRLGMFGFFSPGAFTDESGTTSSDAKVQGNQGGRDAVQALRFLQDNIGAFGGDSNRITVAGQSSGAHLIRSLLNAPSAAPLFQRAILHSDPANFGTQTQTTSRHVSDFALSQTSCSDLSCLRSMSAGDLLDASTAAVQAGQSIDASVAVTEVWRPFVGSFTGSAFEDNPSGAMASGKPIIFTNVENEAGSAVGSLLMPTGADAQSAQMRGYPFSMTREQLLGQMFNDGRASTLSSASQYGMNTNTSAYPSPAQIRLYSQADDSLRRNLETILTQGMFTCPTWNNAQRYASRTPAYVAIFDRGLQYPSNEGIDYCSEDGRVCHEDDIRLVFVDPSKATDGATQKVMREVQARWMGFVRSGSPNAGGYGGWNSVDSSQQTAQVMRLGANDGSSVMDAISLQSGQYAGCGQVWASEVKYDWQLYG